MSLRAKIIAVLIVVPLVAAGVFAPSFARSRVRHGVLSACARRLGAQCQVGSVDLAMDGVLLRRVVVDIPGAHRHVTVSRVGVRFRWPALLLGRTQRLDVQAEGIRL